MLRELSRSRTPVDRLRARATALAAAGIGVAALAATSIAALRADEPTGLSLYYRDADGVEVVEEQLRVSGGLAPFLAQDGLRPGAVLAVVLLVLPFTALALLLSHCKSLKGLSLSSTMVNDDDGGMERLSCVIEETSAEAAGPHGDGGDADRLGPHAP